MKRKKRFITITVAIALSLLLSLSTFSMTIRAGEKEDAQAAAQDTKDADIRKGWVDRIDNDTIVIDDMMYRLSPTTGYFDLHEQSISKNKVHQGQFVGFLQKKGLLMALYFMKPGINNQRPGRVPSASARKQVRPSVLFNEGGVWKN